MLVREGGEEEEEEEEEVKEEEVGGLGLYQLSRLLRPSVMK